MTERDYYRLSGLELAAGWVAGVDSGMRPADEPACSSPVAALERVLVEGLRRPPCVVAFSGGRDSSVLLALAVTLARREGLPDPIAVTHVFSGVAESDEHDWQDAVVRHLGVKEWVRLSHDQELDVVGPVAARQLRRHGVLWPSLLYRYAPLFEVARRGTLVSGEGGDESLGGPFRATPLAMIVKGGARISRRAVKVVAGEAAPRLLRDRAVRSEVSAAAPAWLRPDWRRAFVDRVVTDELAEPLRWDRAVLMVGRRRSVTTGLFRNLKLLAEEEDVSCIHPFLDPDFLRALSGFGGWLGFASRETALEALFDGLVPSSVLSRQSKALFNKTAVTGPSREFLDSWDGRGVPDEMVDVTALEREWRSEIPDARSFPLLQSAWLQSTA